MDTVKVGDWVRSEIDFETEDVWIPYRTVMKVKTVTRGNDVITVTGDVDGVTLYLSNTKTQKHYSVISEPSIKVGDMIRVTYDWETSWGADLKKGDILQVHNVLVGYMHDENLSVVCINGKNRWIMSNGPSRRPEWRLFSAPGY